jgi:hypothetical protein
MHVDTELYLVPHPRFVTMHVQLKFPMFHIPMPMNPHADNTLFTTIFVTPPAHPIQKRRGGIPTKTTALAQLYM